MPPKKLAKRDKPDKKAKKTAAAAAAAVGKSGSKKRSSKLQRPLPVPSPGVPRPPSAAPVIAVDEAKEEEEKCGACNDEINQSYPDRRAAWQPRDPDDDPEMIGCDHCAGWFHLECVDLEPYEVNGVDSFSCAACRPQYGPTIMNKVIAEHRLKSELPEGIGKPMEVGTKPWVEAFIKTEATRFKAPPSPLVTVLDYGHEFEAAFDRQTEWKKIYLIMNKAGLGLTMPDPGLLWIDDIPDLVGNKMLVETIDVYRQVSVPMSVGRFRDLFNAPTRPRLYNILSLEYTGTKLESLILPPSIVQELSWAERYWPMRKGSKSSIASSLSDSLRPNVELFCLMGMGGSYTDFHIDFGGSSVWYHVYRGQKIFYLIEPTEENMKAFEEYQTLPNKSEVFFADLLEEGKCWRAVIPEGATLLIPSGWMHAVYTPVDSLVFGGNYLTDMSVEQQLEVHGQEKRHGLVEYTNFELITWHAAQTITELLKDYNDEEETPPKYLARAAKALSITLPTWIERDMMDEDKEVRQMHAVPSINDCTQDGILAELMREFRVMEKRVGKNSAMLRMRKIGVKKGAMMKKKRDIGKKKKETEEKPKKRKLEKAVGYVTKKAKKAVVAQQAISKKK